MTGSRDRNGSVTEFAQHFTNRPTNSGRKIRSWQLFLLNEKGVNLSSYIQAVCGLRFFYSNTLSRKIEIERIPLPKYEKKLPVILSKEEVKSLLEAPKNRTQGDPPGVGSGQPESWRFRRRSEGDIDSRRQGTQGQASHAGGPAPRGIGRLLAVKGLRAQ